MNATIVWVMIALIAIGGMIADGDDASDQLAKDQKQYCEQVQTFKETNGRQGWPDYRGIYRRVCK